MKNSVESNNIQLLIDLYNIYSPSNKEYKAIEFIKSEIKKHGLLPIVDKWGNIYVQKGTGPTYAAIVSHMDTVFNKRPKDFEVINVKNEILFGYSTKVKDYVGMGADDKNGVWVCLEALKEFTNIKCAFFVGEEVGGIGSTNFDMTFFDDCRYVLQCDRKGNKDLITRVMGTKLCSQEFIKSVNPKLYGYKEESGMFTDVYNLKTRDLDISCCNISCGYYNAHLDTEYTRISDLFKCRDFVFHIIRDCTNVYRHKYDGYGSHYYDDYIYSYNPYNYFKKKSINTRTFNDFEDWYEEEIYPSEPNPVYVSKNKRNLMY